MKNKLSNSAYFLPTLEKEVKEMPITVGDVISKDYKAIVCTETGKIFNIPKQTYTPVTNAQFIEIAHEFTHVTGYEIDGYTSWNEGAKVLAYLRKGGVKENIMGFDCTNHAVLSNAHDGRGAFWVGFSNEFTRCRNQFGRIMELSANKAVRLTHSKHSQSRLEVIKQSFSQHEANVISFEQACEKLSDVKVTKVIQKGLLKTIGIEDSGKDNTTTRMKNILQVFEGCFDTEKKDLGNNLFGLFNAVTRYTTHHRPNKHNVYGKFHSPANAMDNKAFSYLMNLATIK